MKSVITMTLDPIDTIQMYDSMASKVILVFRIAKRDVELLYFFNGIHCKELKELVIFVIKNYPLNQFFSVKRN